MANIITALQILGTLLSEAIGINQQISAAQAAGIDLTQAQLSQIILSYNAALAQLDTDIAKAQAAGK